MASFQKTFRKSGSHHAEFQSLQGVEVKIGEKFKPPRKVTLPVGWQQKDPTTALSLVYDFNLEKDVIAKADALKASKYKELESNSTESNVSSESQETKITPTTSSSIFSNVGTEILQPVVAPGTGHKKKDSFGGKGKNAFDISDFEGDTSTPFELVELQTINDMDELKNVLQPNAVVTTTIENSSTSNTSGKLSNVSSSGSSINLSTNSTLSSSKSSLVNISGLNLADSTSSNPVMEHSGLLLDFGEPQTSAPAVDNLSTSTGSIQSSTLSNTSLNSENRPISRGRLLPPIGQTVSSSGPQQPQMHQSFPAVPTVSAHSSSSRIPVPRGIYSIPNITSPPQERHNSTEGQNRCDSAPSVSTSPRDQLWNMPRSPDFQNVGGRYPSPLPPIGGSSLETDNKQSVSGQSSLPDPWPVLNDTERAFAEKFVGMGFPTPRVARAVQRLGTKDKEVIEFLVNVEELCQNASYSPDSVEVALVFNPEKAKAIEFLELLKTFKEFGFNEDNIHECLRAANNDREKTLEYLMTLSSA
ncbi:ubiquitin-associated protein 1-like [Montipora capricornis]|uniref:ubiquitin-associated protein 1-like n=1 Tax=Montipora capricornis TaxID=246305 RepID=UPI0035F13B28